MSSGEDGAMAKEEFNDTFLNIVRSTLRADLFIFCASNL